MLKEKILTFIQNKDMENLKTLLASTEEMELIDAFYDLSAEEQVIVFRLLAKDHALHIFEVLDTDLQQNLLRSFADDRVIEFVNEMAPDDRLKYFGSSAWIPGTVCPNKIQGLFFLW